MLGAPLFVTIPVSPASPFTMFSLCFVYTGQTSRSDFEFVSELIVNIRIENRKATHVLLRTGCGKRWSRNPALGIPNG